MTVEDIRIDDGVALTLEEVKAEYTDKFIFKIMEFIEDAKSRKVTYEEAIDKYNAELKQKKLSIEQKKEKLNQLGIFAVFDKIDLKDEIARLQNELEQFAHTRLMEIEEDYYSVYKRYKD